MRSQLVQNVYKLSLQEWLIVVEIIAICLFVEVGLRLFPFSRLMGLVQRDAPGPIREEPNDVESRLAEVRRLAEAVFRRYPFDLTCLKRALILKTLVRRQGIQASLKIGLRKRGGHLEAHAWLERGGRGHLRWPGCGGSVSLCPLVGKVSMGGIVGIWNLDGEPVERSLLVRLNACLAHRGADGEGLWMRGAVGLACQNFWVTPESVKETQPAVDPSGAVLLFDGRLDNRGDLLARLKGTENVSNGSSDATLILNAYKAAGAQLPEWLAGDFALALFDPNKHRLLLARDSIGVRPLYYCRLSRTFLFASEIKAILAHPEVTASPNDDLLADFLIDRVYDPELTFFNGICSLPPAHSIVVTPREFRKRRYWDFDPGYRIRLGSFEEYAEAFRELFGQAVRRRLRSAYPVAVSASGGLDSSSILCLAENVTRHGSRSHPDLFGVSYLSPEDTPSDEQTYLTEIEKVYGSHILRIPPGPMNILEGSRQAAWYVEAPFLDEQWGNAERTLRTVQRRGARLMLTGHWGDQFLFSQEYLIDLVRRLKWMTVRTHLREFSRWLTNVDPKWFYRQFFVGLVRESLPDTLVQLLRRLRRGRDGPWYSETFRNRAHQRLRERLMTGSRFPTAYASSLYETARAEYHLFCMEWNNKVAAMHGLEIAFPFLDRELIQFMIAIPGEIHARGGVPKALLRQAMRGVVPAPILCRQWKADFAHLVNAGMDQEYPQLVECLQSGGRATALGYLRQTVLEEELAPLRAGLQRANCRAAWLLSDLLSLELWLQAFFSPKSVQELSSQGGRLG